MKNPVTRRQFARKLGIAGAALSTGGHFLNAKPDPEKKVSRPLALGVDNFAVRGMGWKGVELIDYAAKLELDSLFITDLNAFESREDSHLHELRRRAESKGVKIYLGTWSICPTSVRHKDDWGTVDEHIALSIRMARALGSPVVRVVLGANADRTTPGGIDARIDDTVAVLKRNRSRIVDAGLKIAMENHAGDMHSLELVRLIKEAGPDFVGANMDSGNAVWALEHPMGNLENLGPYVLTTSLRDSAVWSTAEGAAVQWTAMGDGDVDLKAYFARFAELCPEAPVNIETISGFNHGIPYEKESFWKAWPKGKPTGFEEFVALARSGKRRETWTPPKGKDRREAEREYQLREIERSIRYCKDVLGLGRR